MIDLKNSLTNPWLDAEIAPNPLGKRPTEKIGETLIAEPTLKTDDNGSHADLALRPRRGALTVRINLGRSNVSMIWV